MRSDDMREAVPMLEVVVSKNDGTVLSREFHAKAWPAIGRCKTLARKNYAHAWLFMHYAGKNGEQKTMRMGHYYWCPIERCVTWDGRP